MSTSRAVWLKGFLQLQVKQARMPQGLILLVNATGLPGRVVTGSFQETRLRQGMQAGGVGHGHGAGGDQ